MRIKLVLSALAFSALSSASLAQVNVNQEADSRMDRLERDLQLIQKQLANGGDVPLTPEEAKHAGGISNARLGVQMSQIQDELRKMRGQQEQTDFAIKRLQELHERLQKDVDLRLSDLEKKSAETATPAAAAPAPAPTITEPPKADTIKTETPKVDLSKAIIKVEDTKPEDKPMEAKPEVKEPVKTFDQPRDHYNYAFRLLNQTRYDEAAEYFRSFTQKFPKDPLIGNAHYWLGETYYIKREYVKAADNFRQGFEVLPNGPKAADNLLKLAMTLSALKRNPDACTVLTQLTTKFTASSSVLLKKADEEKSRIGCS